MIEIKQLEQSKHKNKYIIHTYSDEYELDEDTIVKYRILKGACFEEKQFEEILNEVKINLNFSKVLHYLSYGSRSYEEIRSYLKQKAVDLKEEDINKILDKLSSFGYIDDQKLAYDLFNYYKENKKGPKYIEQKLMQRKVPSSCIMNAKKEYTSDEEKENMNSIFLKLKDSQSNKPITKQKSFFMQKFLRDGFTSSIVYSFINECNFEDKSELSLQKDFIKAKEKIASKGYSINETKQKIIEILLRKGYSFSQIQECFSNN